jgi:PIN domain nuclease of toxin-antitoxin system
VVSVAYYWEVVIKTQKGLLSISDLATWWRQATELTAARILQIRATHVTALAALPLLHKDPFDRILVALAKAERLGLVTNVGPIGEYPVQTIW